MILQKSIQEVVETAKIEDVVGDFVTLKRRGVNMLGLCPFHNEKTPSFTVSPQKNIYKCFGCGEAGNPISFVMEHEGFSYPEAIRYLANKYGIVLEETVNREEHQEERKLIDSLYIVNEFALEYYQNELLNTDFGRSVGLSYFKERGFREETIKRFGLGYAADASDKFTLTAIQKKYNTDLLKKVGLSNQYGRDFFRSRVMFPIRNLSGKVIGFGGRILGNNKKTAKYLNTPETEIYNKSKVLYGIHYAKKAIRQQDECILVEGYTDVISLSQSGIENVVSSSGTSLTEGQIQLIKRYTPNVKILYDGDAAGIKASFRGSDLLLKEDLNVKVVELPTGEDPDSYIQQVGTTAFKTYLDEKGIDFIFYKTNFLLKDAENDPLKKSNAIKEIASSIGVIPDPTKKGYYVKSCSNLLGIQESGLFNEVNKVANLQFKKFLIEKNAPNKIDNPLDNIIESRPSNEVKPVAEEFTTQLSFSNDFQEKDIVRVLLELGHEEIEDGSTVAHNILADMSDLMESFDNALYGKFVRLYHDAVVAEAHPNEQYFVNHEESDIRKLATDILSFPYDYSENWVAKYEKPLESRAVLKTYYKNDMLYAINRFKFVKINKLYKQNQERLKGIQDMEEMMNILKVQKRIGDLRGQLAALLKTVVM